ncbi:MAG: hypothetical protein H8E26_01255 [FCB group bacterium]|nr:hypothetical protein [FCB group bacterium]MBL7122936.1 hypothetical protein [Candidatus Neomarinimicrobiota bacterium]
MHKSLCTILTLILALNFLGAADLIRPAMSLSQVGSGIRVDLDFQHISADQWRDLLENPELFHNYGYGVAGGPGDAALPMLTIFVPIMSDDSPPVSNIIRNDFVLPDLSLKATPPGHLDSDPQAVEILAYDWNRTTRAHQADILAGEPMHVKSQAYLPITIHPVTLNGLSTSLEVPTSIQFEIEDVSLGDITLITEDGGIRSVTLPEEQFASRGHYLVITPPQFETYIQYFADWKIRMGYEVTIVGTETAGTSASDIKSYIQTAWDTWESRPDYLVIVGDEDQGIPGHYIQNPQGDNLVTDHPYALLEGDDSFPEIMVGRLSVDTVSELISFTAKIVSYESSPYMDNTAWFQRALMISTTWGAASAQATKEWVADKLIEKGFDEVYTAYHPGVSNTSAISTPINSGVGYVNYRGFGMYNGWYGPDFTNLDIGHLIHSGARTPVITSVVCGGGNFAAGADDPCFGEAWTRLGTFAVPNGAVAFFGPSELYTHTQFNNVIDIGIYSGIFDQGISTLGEALWNGKFELWRNYHSNTYFPFGQTPEFYHHIYNLLGDPGMQLWTAVPQTLSVEHTDTLTTGDNNLSILVSDVTGAGIAGAYVALSNDENAWGGYTDVSGQIMLPFVADAAEEIDLTITGKNLLPYLATIPITTQNHPLELNDWTLQAGGQPTAGENSTMLISLENPGPALSDIEMTLTSNSPDFFLEEIIMVDSIPAQSIWGMEPVTLNIPDLPHGTPFMIELEILVDGALWSWQKFFTIQAPQLSLQGVNVVAGDLLAGESAELELELLNQGGAASQPVTITPLESEFITFSPGALSCPSIDMDESATTTQTLEVLFDELLFPGEQVPLSFECVQENSIDTLDFIIQLAGANRFGPSQRDSYGYRMFDNYDLNYSKAPVYEWLEIDTDLGGDGSEINITDTWEEDDASQSIALPFPVNYYGTTYNQITVCSNGWAAFGDQSVVNFHNRTIPSPIGPTAMLAPFWDDLITYPGAVYSKYYSGNDMFVIEWSRMRNLYASNELSFQIVIYGASAYPTETGENDIKFQYKNFENVDIEANFSTIGIESPDSEIGILASYNNINDPSIADFSAGTALLFTTDRGSRLGDSQIAFSTTSLSFEQVPWSSARDSIIISNSGESPLIYEISVVSDLQLEPAVVEPVDPLITKYTPDAPGNGSVFREGSDAYGYHWKDNNDEGGPNYNWINIENEANRVPYGSAEFDDCVVSVDLGFEFPLYDEAYSVGQMGSNGTITFAGFHSPWYNIALPANAAPGSLLAPWWDDLNNDTGPQGTFYFWSNGFDQCIMTWKDFPKFGTESFYSFQVILDAFGTIKFQYEDVAEIIASSTIGIQNLTRNMGLTVRHNSTSPFESGAAIAITPPTQWFSGSNWTQVVNPGESIPFIVDIEPRNSAPGQYETTLLVATTAPNAPETIINITLDVFLGETPYGDINGDYLVNVHDVTQLFDFILLLEEMSEQQFILADLSGDEHIDVIDLILLIESINSMDGP